MLIIWENKYIKTNNQTDLAIKGKGEFVLSNDKSGMQQYPTKNGEFTRTKTGYLISKEERYVLGINESGNITPIKLPKKFSITDKGEFFSEENTFLYRLYLINNNEKTKIETYLLQSFQKF